MKRNVQSYLPLKDLELAVLLALHEAPQHGYALFTRVAEQTEGYIVPGPTSLYRTLAELTRSGLITKAKAPAGEVEDPRRRYYTMSALGRSVLSAELGRLAALLRQARRMNVEIERPV